MGRMSDEAKSSDAESGDWAAEAEAGVLAEAHGIAGLMALFGIESPGLTSSLAIGEAVAAGLAAD